jgi:hypothetical protein
MSHETAPTAAHGNHVTIFINTVPFQVPHGRISYEELAKLEYPGDDVNDKEIIYTISVEYAGMGPISLARGDKPVHVEEGMECNVRKSGRS